MTFQYLLYFVFISIANDIQYMTLQISYITFHTIPHNFKFYTNCILKNTNIDWDNDQLNMIKLKLKLKEKI